MRDEQATTDTLEGRSRDGGRVLFRAAKRTALRFAAVRGGAVVDERILERHATLSVGPSERDTIVVPSGEVSTRVEMIRPTGRGSYRLIVPAQATGVVAIDEERIVFGFADAGVVIPISPGARGRVSMAGITILFQLTERPPKAKRRALPRELRQGLEIDWASTVIAAFSFLFHFGLVGAIYSDWLDPLVDDHLIVGNVIESLAALPVAPPVEAVRDNASSNQANAAPSKPHQEGTHRASSNSRSVATASPSMSDARAASIARELMELDVSVATTLRAGGASTDRVLSQDSPMPNLDELGSQDRATNREAIRFGRGDQHGPAQSADLRDLAHLGDGDRVADSGHAIAPVHAPGARVDVTTSAHPNSLPDAPGVIARLQGRFHRCYEKGLRTEDASMRGTMRLTINVAPNGEVAGTSAKTGGSLSGTVVSCVQGAAAGAHFQVAEGGLGGTLLVPITFQPQL